MAAAQQIEENVNKEIQLNERSMPAFSIELIMFFIVASVTLSEGESSCPESERNSGRWRAMTISDATDGSVG